MRKFLKIILIVVTFVITALIVQVIAVGTNMKNGGFIGMIFLLAYLAGARAIWKYDPEKKTDNTNIDKHKLDKS